MGGPINPGNALRRYVRPVVSNLGIQIGGWHDFRHTLITRLRKLGWAPKVTSQIVGHSTIRVTEEIYDHADADDFRSALNEVAFQLEPDGTQSAVLRQYLINLLLLKKYLDKHQVKLNGKEIMLIYIDMLKEYKLTTLHKGL